MSDVVNPFPKKGWGRIYIMGDEPMENGLSREYTTHQIVKLVDPFEYDYIPERLITAWRPEDIKEVRLVFLGKYEACMNAITFACWKAGIAVWCIGQREEPFQANPVEP